MGPGKRADSLAGEMPRTLYYSGQILKQVTMGSGSGQ